MEALKVWTLAVAGSVAMFGAVGCSDDDGGDNGGPMDSGTMDSTVPDATTTPDAGDSGVATSCTSYTPPSGGMCGGSHCDETLAELTESTPATATCKKPEELAQFCDLTAVQTVQGCVLAAVTSPQMPQGEALATAVKTCAEPMLPDYTSGCLDCFVASATCAAAKCFNQCSSNPNSPACDQCRVTQGCIGEFYTCSGMENPLTN